MTKDMKQVRAELEELKRYPMRNARRQIEELKRKGEGGESPSAVGYLDRPVTPPRLRSREAPKVRQVVYKTRALLRVGRFS